jgi:hypothetical protein
MWAFPFPPSLKHLSVKVGGGGSPCQCHVFCSLEAPPSREAEVIWGQMTDKPLNKKSYYAFSELQRRSERRAGYRIL